MDEIVKFSVLFNDKARSSTVSYTKAYEIHLAMFQRALRQIIYTELQRQYMAAEEFAAQTQTRNLILAFQRGLRHIAQWDDNQMQRFVHGVSAASVGGHLFRMPGDLLQTLSNLVHMLMFTNSDVIDLVENRLTHCPGFAINTETTIGEFVVKCMKEAALHFDSTPFLFSRAEKPQHWIENRQKIMQQIDQVVSMVVNELATNIVSSVCQKLMYQVRDPGVKTRRDLSSPSAPPPPHSDVRRDVTTSSASVSYPTTTQTTAKAKTTPSKYDNNNNERVFEHRSIPKTNDSRPQVAEQPSTSYRRDHLKQQQQQLKGQQQQTTAVTDNKTKNATRNDELYANYNSSSTEAHHSTTGKNSLYTDRRLLSGHATDQDYIEHAYMHGAFRNTSTPVQPPTHRVTNHRDLTTSSTTTTAAATKAPIVAPNTTAITTINPTSPPHAARTSAAEPSVSEILQNSQPDTRSQPKSFVSPSASTVAAAVTTEPFITLDSSVPSQQDKTDSSNNLSDAAPIVTVVVDDSADKVADNGHSSENTPHNVAEKTTDIPQKEVNATIEFTVTDDNNNNNNDNNNNNKDSDHNVPPIATLNNVVLENSESRPKPNEAQPLPLIHDQDDDQESNNSVPT